MLRAAGADAEASGVLVDFSEPMLARAARQPRRLCRALAGRHRRSQRSRLARRAARRALRRGRLRARHPPPPTGAQARAVRRAARAARARRHVREHGRTSPSTGRCAACSTRRCSPTPCAPSASSGGTRHEHEVDLEDDHDRPDTVEDQLRWLRDAGFEQVEVHFKWAEAAIFGGMRPAR